MIYYIYIIMSIPIIDINAGDTVSAMVDKINYNFTLVSLKGGGPQGVQGVQGIRGPAGPKGDTGETGDTGSMIYSVPNPPAAGMRPGDINIYDGVIEQLAGDGTLITITDLNTAVDSPFGISESDTINPKSGLSSYPFILGVGAGDGSNAAAVSQTRKAAMHIALAGGTNDHVHFYNGQNLASPCGSLLFDSGAGNSGSGFVVESDNGASLILRRSGSSAADMKSIELTGTGIYIPSRKTDYSAPGAAQIVATNVSTGKIDDNAKWAIEDNHFYPMLASGVIGKSTSHDKCIMQLNMKISGAVVVNGQTNTQGSFDQLKDTCMKFLSRPTTDTLDSAMTDIMWLSKYGVALGGLANTQGPGSRFETDVFSAKIVPPENNMAASLCIGSRMMATSSSVAMSSAVRSFPGGGFIDDNAGNYPDYNARGSISLSSGTDAQKFVRNKHTSLISAIKKIDGGKTANDTLHLHGADGTSGTGCDVVITGGNTIATSNFNYVGGDVYIAGGSAIESVGATQVNSDLRREGNVIIGINPFNHAGTFTAECYSSKCKSGHNSDLNPNRLGFFDVNNVAVHGNKITLDSNANFRMLTNMYMTGKNLDDSLVLPYVADPENATISVNGINTMMHSEPVCLGHEDICSHQFMSGVMRRIIKLKYENNGMNVSFIEPDRFGESDIAGDNGSVFFITDQVWQKIGNVVNVQAYGRWFANRGRGADKQLYHITDYMFFGPGGTENYTDFSGAWGSPSTAGWCYNATLGHLLLRPTASEPKYNSFFYNTISGQPLTVFVLPFTIDNMAVTHCYGNGNIFTETPEVYKKYSDANHLYQIPNMYVNAQEVNLQEKTQYVDVDPTNSVLMSTPVTVGAYYRKNTSGVSNGLNTINPYNYTDFGSGVNSGDSHNGGKGAIHTSNNSTWNTYDFTSRGLLRDDARMGAAADNSHVWNESRFVKTEVIPTGADDKKYCYIYPEMLSDMGNFSLGDIEQGAMNFNMQGRYLRPCVGMYTWISLNYSYCIMDKFNYEFTKFGYHGNWYARTDVTGGTGGSAAGGNTPIK